jgi:uncharacterized membrane protein
LTIQCIVHIIFCVDRSRLFCVCLTWRHTDTTITRSLGRTWAVAWRARKWNLNCFIKQAYRLSCTSQWEFGSLGVFNFNKRQIGFTSRKTWYKRI